MEINKCPMCGSKAHLGCTGASECYGYAWQTLYIACYDEFDRKCNMNVSIEADWSIVDTNNSEELIITTWNALKGINETNPNPT